LGLALGLFVVGALFDLSGAALASKSLPVMLVIGIMDGPVIQNTNDTYPLFELSEAFRHCVRLSFAPEHYENVQRRKPVETVVEPYPLSPRPHLPHQRKLDGDETSVTNLTDTLQHKEKSPIGEFRKLGSIWTSQYQFIKQRIKGVPSSISGTWEYLAMLPQVVRYCASRMWNWRQEGGEESDFEGDDEGEIILVLYRPGNWQRKVIVIFFLVSHVVSACFRYVDWDWNWSTEGELRFNAVEQSRDGTPETRTRVAELSIFSPNTFAHLRNSIFGITEDEYRQSLFGSGPFVSFQSNSKGAARVGGVFFFTRDGTYMIKTIKKEEAKTFLKMLPKYHKHMKRYARTSLLTRFCGMYGVRIYDEGSLDHGKLHTFVVMNSAFPPEASRFISERFDLKGSTVGREVSEEELKSKGRDAVMKDLDLAREVQLIKSIKQDGDFKPACFGFNIGPQAKSALLAQLREDVNLLVECQVMDYSLLVGVVDMESFVHFDRSARKAIHSMQRVGRKFSTSKKIEERALWAIGGPIRLLGAPPSFIAKQVWSLAHRTLSSIVTLPLPYYGSGECGVDGGLLSVFHGTRNGKRALYYMGLIDFLQPWTTRKVFERQLKGLIGQDINAISCVTPEEYAHRFLEFLDAHLS
jgi:hypothetical protein